MDTNNSPSPQTGEKELWHPDNDFLLWVIVNKWEYDAESHTWCNNYVTELHGLNLKYEKLVQWYFKNKPTHQPPAAQSDQEAAEKYAKENCPSCSQGRFIPCVCSILKPAYLAGCTHVRSQQEEVERLNKENAQLKTWKEQMLVVLGNIDLQKAASLLKLEAGTDISKHILPAIERLSSLTAENERLKKQIEEAMLTTDNTVVELYEENQRLLSKYSQLPVTGDAIAFGEWLRTFGPLTKENGYWVIESQVSTQKLYALFTARNPTPKQGSHD